jgi:glutamyl-tRNA reductase
MSSVTQQRLTPAAEHVSASSGTLLLVGVNHTTAPIEVRERLSLSATRLPDAVRTLTQQPGVRESMILSTCNRVEFLVWQEQDEGRGNTNLLRFLHEYYAIPASSVESHLYEFRDREAIRHLFRVASSLDSMVVGEPQILGQVKEAYSCAREAGAVAACLEPLLQRAFSVAKRVRSETQIGSSSVSIASVAVELARKIFGSLQGKTVLLVGAGKMSDLAARHLLQQGATSILVSNRTRERAALIAGQMTEQISAQIVAQPNAPRCSIEVVAFEQLYEQAARADIVVTSTGAQTHIFDRSHGLRLMERRRNRPMFFIDIAVPRDVDPGVNEIEGCFLYDIDDLQQVAAAHLADRSRESAEAEKIVTAEVEKYHQHLERREVVPAIVALQENAEAVRQLELARAAKRLGSLTAEQQAAVEALTRSLTAKLLHPQIVDLRKKSEER